VAGLEAQLTRETKPSGLGSRPSGLRYGLSGTGTGTGLLRALCPEPVPEPEHLYQIPEGRDLGPENGFTFALLHKPKAGCTFARLSAKPSAAGARSRRPKAGRLAPERPMPRWPSPVTRKCFPNRQPLTAVRLLLHLCTGRRPVALLHSGQHVVLSLPKAVTPPILHTQYSILSFTSGQRANGSTGQLRCVSPVN